LSYEVLIATITILNFTTYVFVKTIAANFIEFTGSSKHHRIVIHNQMSYLSGEIADKTNISITISTLLGGGRGMGVSVMSHKKTWHLDGSYILFSCTNYNYKKSTNNPGN